MVSFPYYSHTGMVWEASHKGVPLLGVPGITLDLSSKELRGRMWLKCLIITGSLWALNEMGRKSF